MAVAKRALRRRWGAGASALAWLVLAACSGPAVAPVPGGTPRSRGTVLERLPALRRNDLVSQMEQTAQYYTAARRALDANQQAQYIALLAQAQAEALAAARRYPDASDPHNWMGIITAYRGDLAAAATSFRNALQLAQREFPRPSTGDVLSNLAHIAVYQGRLDQARLYLRRAERAGASEDEIARISILAAWKAGDLTEARDLFADAVRTSEPFAQTWDAAPLPEPLVDFEDFTAACCRNPTCGPHMDQACEREAQAVRRRELALETLAQEMALERERRRALREIYAGRKDLTITLDDPTAPEADAAAAPSAQTPSIPRPNPRRRR